MAVFKIIEIMENFKSLALGHSLGMCSDDLALQTLPDGSNIPRCFIGCTLDYRHSLLCFGPSFWTAEFPWYGCNK